MWKNMPAMVLTFLIILKFCSIVKLRIYIMFQAVFISFCNEAYLQVFFATLIDVISKAK